MRTLNQFLFAVFCALLSATTVDSAQWSRTYGPGSAAFIQQTTDGGYVLAGYLNPDAWVAKLDPGGNPLWKRTFGVGDPRMQSDAALNVQPVGDGGYIVFGSHYVFSIWQPALSPWVLRLGSDGKVLWQKTYVGLGQIYSVQPTQDGGWLGTGLAYTSGAGRVMDALVLKFDADFNLNWGAAYGGDHDDFAAGARPTSDGGHVIAGSTASAGEGGRDAWVAKLREGGEIVWQKTYGGPGEDAAAFVWATANGGYLVVGTTSSFGAGQSDAWALKLDESGSVVWQRTYGGTGNDTVIAVLPTQHDGCIVAGSSESFGAGHSDAWVFELDGNGDVLWQRTIGGTGYDNVSSLQPTIDGGYVIAGSTNSFSSENTVAWALKLDATGAIASCPLVGPSRIAMGSSRAVARDAPLGRRVVTATPIAGNLSSAMAEVSSSEQCVDSLPASRLTAVEYHHSAYDHYFVTTSPQEIAALDGGAYTGWGRTGQSFQVYGLDQAAASVCRFWSGQTFAPKSSHFYTPYVAECATVNQKGVWQFEGDVVRTRDARAGQRAAASAERRRNRSIAPTTTA